MRTIRVRSWPGFIKAIERIRREYETHRRVLEDGSPFERPVRLLFRGQANKKWNLETTLERSSKKERHVLSYVELATRQANQLESITGSRWAVPTYPDLEKEIQYKQEAFKVHFPCYDYLVYLRHHAFPSPFLDWTESPYIAAYFAFIDAVESSPAVYCYIERPNLVKGSQGGAPMISVFGPYVTTHKRHFAQKCWYTTSTKWDYETKKHFFCPHESIFDRSDPNQDVLIKIEVPKKERTLALKQLNDYNINHFTLFQSEDSLVKALSVAEFVLNDGT